MKELLSHLYQYKTISKAQARETLKGIAEGKFPSSQVSSFLTVYCMRRITIEELSGFREAMLELALPVDLSEFETIDVCGTGGDGKSTFNVSTLSAFVLAACGVNVAKHGNYGVSSICGSSNVLEALGIRFTSDISLLKKQLDTIGLCFLHAPLFHPAMKEVAPLRRELGVRTFFNILGPLVNPSRPRRQVIGVFNLEVGRLYSYLLQNTPTEAFICHALDGYDEISLTGAAQVRGPRFDRILTPSDFGYTPVSPSAIRGGNSVEEGAKLFKEILSGKGTEEQNRVVAANAAIGLLCSGKVSSCQEGAQLALEVIRSGKGAELLRKLIQ